MCQQNTAPVGRLWQVRRSPNGALWAMLPDTVGGRLPGERDACGGAALGAGADERGQIGFLAIVAQPRAAAEVHGGRSARGLSKQHTSRTEQ